MYICKVIFKNPLRRMFKFKGKNSLNYALGNVINIQRYILMSSGHFIPSLVYRILKMLFTLGGNKFWFKTTSMCQATNVVSLNSSRPKT